MKCSSKVQAERVARIGAAKMAGAGYRVERSASNPSVFRVVKQDGSFYWAQVEGPGTRCRCMCPFFGENAQFGTCKHLEFVRAEVEAQAYCAAHALPVEPIATYRRPVRPERAAYFASIAGA